ncbi:MAG: ABC transporter permease [Candidatus Sumerlaeaceae bacterium]
MPETSSAPVPAGSIWDKRIPMPAQAPLLRSGGVFAKDLLHHFKIVVTMILASCFAVYLPWLAELFDGRNATPPMQKLQENAASIYLALLITSAFVFGLVLSADEVENRTLSFLDTLPCSRMQHFMHKFAVGAVMLLIWTIVAALLMGWLSDNGFALLRSLVRDKIQLFSVALDFHSSGPITLLRCISLLVTGLACGFLFQNLAPSAILGILVYCTYLVTVGKLFVRKNHTDQTIMLINGVSLAVWTLLMVAAYPRMFRHTHTYRADAAARVEASSPWWQRITSFLQYRRTRHTRVPFDPPHRYLLRLPVTLLCVVCAITPGVNALTKVEADNAPNLYLMLMFGVPVTVALIGSGLWLPEERVSPRFAVYTLPITRQRIFWPRIAAAGVALLAIYLSCLVGFSFIAISKFLENGWRIESFPLEMPLFTLGVLGALMSCGAMFRLFYKSRLIATVFSCMVVFAWALVAAQSWVGYAHTLGYRSPPRLYDTWMGFAPLLYALWIMLIVVGLPVLVSYLGFCRTRLLETAERTRGSISLVLFVVLIVWGAFLINTVPAQLITMLFVR